MVPIIFITTWYTNHLNKVKAAGLEKLIAQNGWTPEDVQKEADRYAVSPCRFPSLHLEMRRT
jgi:hypothetical protein